MTAKAADWVAESTSSTGVSDLTLIGAIPGYGTFKQAFPTGALVWYSILAENGDRESGQGQYDAVSNVLARSFVLSSIKGGLYGGAGTTPPSKINLNGKCVVACTMNSDALNKLIDKVDNLSLTLVRGPKVFGPTVVTPTGDIQKGDFWLVP